MGDLRLVESVLHPTDFSPASERAFADALAIAVLSGARLDILHAGPSLADDWEAFPAARKTLERWSDSPELAWRQESAQGDVVEEILMAGRESDLIAMPTAGAHGIWDALRGSTTSQVVRSADCPVLAVPAR